MSPQIVTVAEALAAGTRRLRAEGMESAALDMSLLLAETLGLDRLGIFLNQERPLDPKERARLRVLFDRRLRREPMAYILGRREFYGLTFMVSRDVLIPRPETEHLVEAVLAWLKARPVDAPEPLLADIGTGSGAIAVAAAHHFPAARWLATDVSESALGVAALNAERHGARERIELRQGSLYEPIDETLDAIVSNPPYIADGERAGLEPDVRDWEPAGALFAGPDGLDCIRELIAGAPERLRSGGRLWMEIGSAQSGAVKTLLEANGAFEQIKVITDYAGLDRVVAAVRK